MKDNKNKKQEAEYIAPIIEVIEIEIESSILSLSMNQFNGPTGPSLRSGEAE